MDSTFTLPSPEPIISSATITSTPRWAKVYIDDKLVGDTPLLLPSVNTGHHAIRISREGYKEIIDTFSVKEGEPKEYHATLQIDSAQLHKAQQKPKPSITAKPELIKRTGIYIGIQGSLGLGMFSNTLGVSAGGYLANANMELSYRYGLVKSSKIYWYDSGAENYESAYETEYRPSVIGAKGGYQFRLTRFMSLTPQVGLDYTILSSTRKEANGHGSNCLSGTVSARLFAAFNRFSGFSITPEYAFGLTESNGFKTLSLIDPRLADYKSGFTISAAMVFFF